MAIYDISGKPVVVESGGLVTETLFDNHIFPVNGFYETAISADMYNAGAVYGNNKAIAVELEANKPYIFVCASSNAVNAPAGFRNFNGSKPSADYPSTRMWEADCDADGNLTGTYTEVTPTIIQRFLSWDTGVYNEYNNLVPELYPIDINGTTYYIKALVFSVAASFRGYVILNYVAPYADAAGEYIRIYDYDVYQYRPFKDGLITLDNLPYTRQVLDMSYISDDLKAYMRENALLVSILNGKTWACAGDSLTFYSGGKSNVDNPDDTGFITQIARKTGIVGTNLGYAGMKWSSGTNGSFETGSAVERVNTIIQNGELYDYITFAYGTNSDVDGVGTLDDDEAYDGTMVAAMKWCFNRLIEYCPNTQIGVILPPQRAEGNSSQETRNEMIKEVCQSYGIPCLDLFHEGGFNAKTLVASKSGNTGYFYLSDGLHLNDRGKQKYAAALQGFLLSMATPYDGNSKFLVYSITNTLTNAATSNAATRAVHGGSYSATIVTEDSFTLSAVTVTMGGVDITADVYTDGVISIAEITGDIVITATAE